MVDVLSKTNNFDTQYVVDSSFIYSNSLSSFGHTPPNSSWYIDTEAPSHMISDVGTLSSNFNLSTKNEIIVENVVIVFLL